MEKYVKASLLTPSMEYFLENQIRQMNFSSSLDVPLLRNHQS